MKDIAMLIISLLAIVALFYIIATCFKNIINK